MSKKKLSCDQAIISLANDSLNQITKLPSLTIQGGINNYSKPELELHSMNSSMHGAVMHGSLLKVTIALS